MSDITTVRPGRRYKLNPEKQDAVRAKFADGATEASLAREYSCSMSTIYRIIRRSREDAKK